MKKILPLALVIFAATFAAAQCPPPGFPDPGNTCPQAPILCPNLDGYCSTINNNNVSQPFPGCGAPWTLNNDEWFAFFAGSTSITIQVTPSNCSSGLNMGLQGGIYFGCGGPVMDVQCACTTDPFILSANNFIVGQIYWFVLDGCGGNVCDYTIDVLSGSTVGVPPADPGPVSGPITACQGGPALNYNIGAVPAATIYNWSVTPAGAGTVSGTGNNINVTWNQPGMAQLCVNTSNLCYSNPINSCITVDVQPTPTATLSGSGVLCDQGATNPVDLSIAFTGNGPWQFVYSIGGVQQPPITTSNNPYTLTVTNPGTVQLVSVSSTTGNCPGTVSGSTVITETIISANTQAMSPDCNGGNSGFINLTVSGGATPYTYSWSNGASNEDPSGLPAGSYTVTVTDANGCTQTASATLTDPPLLDASISGTDPDCNNGNDGSVNLTVSGGTSPYSFDWSNGATTEDLNNVPAGTYTVTVTDDNGCEQTASVTLANPPAISASASGTDPLCNASNSGSINLTVGGGATPYAFQWSNGATSQNPANLPAGTYTVTVTDANGCTQTTSVTLGQPPQLTASATATAPLCNNGNDGSISLTVGGGTPSYSFQWSNGATSQNPTGLSPGGYTVTVTDANGCTQTTSVNISNPLPIALSLLPVNPGCNGAATGSVSVNIGNATAPFTWNWSNGSSSQNPTGLASGSYTVTVTDANGCTQTASTSLTDPPQLNASVSNVVGVDCDTPTGSISTSVSGGTPGYSYAWGPSGSGANPSGLPVGTYMGTITDANGCTTTVTATIGADLTPPVAVAGGGDTLTCAQTTLVLSGAGSSAGSNFTYQWSGPGIVSGGNTLAPTINQPGNYTITVTNTTNGCTQTATINVPQNIVQPTATATSPPITCNNSTVTINGNGSSAGPNFTYQWSGPSITGGGTTLNPTVNQPGVYTLVVTNSINGCTANTTVTVPDQTQPPVAVATTSDLTCTVTSLTINGNGSSAGPNFSYNWTTSGGNIVSGGNTLTPTVNEPGLYTLTVTNTTTGCQNTVSVNVIENLIPPAAEAGQPAQLDCDSPTVQLNGTGSSGGPFNYQWTGPNIVSGGTTLFPIVGLPGV